MKWHISESFTDDATSCSSLSLPKLSFSRPSASSSDHSASPRASLVYSDSGLELDAPAAPVLLADEQVGVVSLLVAAGLVVGRKAGQAHVVAVHERGQRVVDV
eukprot:GHUV01042045.1.p2 GENE.GHUV01042045.1~~GHUV01042045.1.p2  ORF type:complete len:103 (-),score=1.34 GHUV01042045.1:119-427(-)